MKNTFELEKLNSRLPIIKWGFSVFGFILLIVAALIVGIFLSNLGNTTFSTNSDLDVCVRLISYIK